MESLSPLESDSSVISHMMDWTTLHYRTKMNFLIHIVHPKALLLDFKEIEVITNHEPEIKLEPALINLR